MLAKVLGGLPNLVLVSEVNPVGNAYTSISDQARQWYGIAIPKGSYAQELEALQQWCREHDKKLLIRDFSFNNFYPNIRNDLHPSQQLEALKMNVSGKFAFVRDAYDVWISQQFPKNFSSYYLNYVEQLIEKQIPIFKYEDFCLRPEEELAKMTQIIGCERSDEALLNFQKNQKVTGDNQMDRISRGRQEISIRQFPRKRISKHLEKQALADTKMSQSNQLLGYSGNFNDALFESSPKQFYLEIKSFINRTLKANN